MFLLGLIFLFHNPDDKKKRDQCKTSGDVIIIAALLIMIGAAGIRFVEDIETISKKK